jgi:hypothetical protein
VRRIHSRHGDLALVARPVPLQDLDRRRLACPVRAEQRDDLSPPHVVVDPQSASTEPYDLHSPRTLIAASGDCFVAISVPVRGSAEVIALTEQVCARPEACIGP